MFTDTNRAPYRVGVFHEEKWAIDWLMEEARPQLFSD
jgi:hypothetical protein